MPIKLSVPAEDIRLERSDDWIYKVVDYIEYNINSPISLEELAELSGYSLRHFQRLFREKSSENIMDYVRGRRLTLAMEEITKAEKSIIDIAFEYQFESQQSFTRAFQARFTFPPIRFRNTNVVNPPSSKKRLESDYLRMIENNDITQEPEIVQLDEMLFVGMPVRLDVNSYGDSLEMSRLPDLVHNFRQRKSEIPNVVLASPDEGAQIITYRVPKAERAHGDGIVAVAVVQVESESEIPSDMISIKTPATKFAKFEYRGAFENYSLVGYYITGCWFPRSPYWIGNAPVLNTIRTDPLKPDSSNLKCFLPLRPRHPRLIDRWWH